MLKFSPANSKIHKLSKIRSLKPYLTNGNKIYSFDLISGYSCGFAHKCLSKAVQSGNTRKIVDGPSTEFRCYSASQEVLYTNLFRLRMDNFNYLRQFKTVEELVKAIQSFLPKNAGIIRLHSAGDFYCENYFLAWLEIARLNPNKLFYAYTKSLPYWVKNKKLVNKTPNLVLTASYGGRRDDLIKPNKLRSATVVFSQYKAKKLKLVIDHDDSHAARPDLKMNSFALLLHNSQPKGSVAAKSWQRIKSTVGGYSR